MEWARQRSSTKNWVSESREYSRLGERRVCRRGGVRFPATHCPHRDCLHDSVCSVRHGRCCPSRRSCVRAESEFSSRGSTHLRDQSARARRFRGGRDTHMDAHVFRQSVLDSRRARAAHGVVVGPRRNGPRVTRPLNAAVRSCIGHRDTFRSNDGWSMTNRGSTLPLVAGLFALCGAVVVGIIGSTDLALTRTELQTVADGAALSAAGSITPSTVVLHGSQFLIRLTDSSVRRDASTFIRASAVTGVRLVSARTPDSRTAVVTLSRVWRPPMVSEFLPYRLTLSATARARSVLR